MFPKMCSFGKRIMFSAGLVGLLLLTAAPGLNADEMLTRKVVVLIIDNISLSDLEGKELPNFTRIIETGGLGLMNTRTGSLLSSNRASAYLTIGMGVRTQVPEQIQAADVEKIRQLVNHDYPNYILGKIGEVAKQSGVKISLVGNADTDRPLRHAALIAMDGKGNIPMGNVGRDLLLRDPAFPWGYRTNPEKLLEYSLKALATSDLVFIDFGDTTRVDEAALRNKINKPDFQTMKAKAVKYADSFLGELMRKTADDNTVLMIISPTPSFSNTSFGSKTLTPILIYERGQPAAVLSSMTTRRVGLVANIDIGPTIFNKLGLNEEEFNFLGQQIITIPDSSNYETVSGNLSRYIAAKRSRYVVHGMYVLFLVLALVLLYFKKPKAGKILHDRAGRVLAVMVLALPAASYVIPAVLNNSFPYLELLLIGLVTVALGIVLSKDSNRAVAGMACLSLVTSLTLVACLLTGSETLPLTPLGFNDVFTGGRYYGINNDSMGILLGATVFAVFYFLERLKLNRILRVIIAFLALSLVLLSQTPGFGANVGGSIAAMTTGVVALNALISGQPIRKGKVLAVIGIVFVVEVFIAYLDSIFGQQTHAGRIMAALMSQNFADKFLEILKSKLSLFLIMLVIPPWNFLLAAQIYVYYLVRRRLHDVLNRVNRRLPVFSRSFEVILYGGLVAFAFNDTGVIATGLMFTYMTMPLGVMLLEEKRGG